VEEGDLIAYSAPERTLNVVGIKGTRMGDAEIRTVLAQRAEAGVIQRPKRKGLLARYTKHALSAMEGAGY
jgi:dihydroxy-acid dehydratase